MKRFRISIFMLVLLCISLCVGGCNEGLLMTRNRRIWIHLQKYNKYHQPFLKRQLIML